MIGGASNPTASAKGRLAISYRNASLLFLFFLALILGSISGYRLLGEGRDYLIYFENYETIRLSDSLDLFRFEPGYMLTVWLSRFWLGLPFEVFVSLLSGAALFLKFCIFSRYRRPILTVLLYVAIWYPLHEYTQLRIAVALSFSLLATEFYFQERRLLFFAFLAAAVSFHASALLMAVAVPGAYFLTRFRFPVVLFAIGASGVVLAAVTEIVLVVAVYFNPLIESYITNIEGSAVNLFSGFNVLSGALLVSILFAKSATDRRDRTLFIIATAAFIAAITLQFVPVLSFRIKEILLVFMVPLAFNGNLTKRAIPQFLLAIILAGWSLYSAFTEGIIGFGP